MSYEITRQNDWVLLIGGCGAAFETDFDYGAGAAFWRSLQRLFGCCRAAFGGSLKGFFQWCLARFWGILERPFETGRRLQIKMIQLSGFGLCVLQPLRKGRLGDCKLAEMLKV